MNTDYPKDEVERIKRRDERQRKHAEEYPNEETTEGEPSLHIFGSDDAGWVVWLNPDPTPDTGLCIGSGDTRDLAVANAAKELETALDKLQSSPKLS